MSLCAVGLDNALVPGAASLCLPLEWWRSGNLSVLQKNRSPQIYVWFQLVSITQLGAAPLLQMARMGL